MGSAPTPSGSLKWHSLITVEGGPVEYSWKWNTKKSKPDIRYSLEPINSWSGTPVDPMNQAPGSELLHRLAESMPSTGIDLTWVDYFLATLFRQDKTEYMKEAKAAGGKLVTTSAIAVEFLAKGLGFKAYFAPPPFCSQNFAAESAVESGNGHVVGRHEPALKMLHPKSASREALLDFLKTSTEGPHMIPFIIAVDCVKPETSRLKWYFNTPHTSFNSVKEIMTLGGRLTSTPVEDIRELFLAALGLPADYPDSSEVAVADKFNPDSDKFVGTPGPPPGMTYYFDIPPGAELPEVKLYIPVWRYGKNDLSVIEGTVAWMEKKGRGGYTQQFKNMMENMVSHRSLGDDLGLQAYVSCVYKTKDEELDVTTYMSAEALHPQRLAEFLPK